VSTNFLNKFSCWSRAALQTIFRLTYQATVPGILPAVSTPHGHVTSSFASQTSVSHQVQFHASSSHKPTGIPTVGGTEAGRPSLADRARWRQSLWLLIPSRSLYVKRIESFQRLLGCRGGLTEFRVDNILYMSCPGRRWAGLAGAAWLCWRGARDASSTPVRPRLGVPLPWGFCWFPLLDFR
jgi:hypothetical protein